MPKARHYRSPSEAFKRVMGRLPQRVNPFTMPVSKATPKPLDPGALYHYWHPDRDGVELAPVEVQSRLIEIAGHDAQGKPNLICCRPPTGAPIRCRGWNVFYRKPEITHWLSPGWMLILAWNDGAEPHPRPLEIDNRLYANLYLQSLKGGRATLGRDFENAAEYFNSIVGQMRDDKQNENERQREYRHERARDLFDHQKISSAGKGNKFALHHDGTIIPSRGEKNWTDERAKHNLPGEVLRAERDAVERRRDTRRHR